MKGGKALSNAAHQARLIDKGWRRLNVWLSPVAATLLAALAPRHGSASKAIEAGLKKLSEESE